MRYASAAADALATAGVEVMFGIMGDGNMHIVERFVTEQSGRFVAAAHESGAVLMANGYAAVTGRVGVATVTHGAIANTISALLDGVRGRYPVVVVAGDTAATDGFNLQNVPQRDLVLPTGAGFHAAASPQTAASDVATAVRRARTERRPVVLDIPADFDDAEVEYHRVRPTAAPFPVWEPQRAAVEEAVGVLAAGHHPVLVAGRGAAHARPELLRLAERIGAPVATTLRGKGLFAGDPFDLGICGTLATPIGLKTIAEADCLVVLGAGLNPLTADGGDLLIGKRIVQCDTDPAVFGRYYPVDVAITGDAGRVAAAITALCDEAGLPSAGYRSDALRGRLAAPVEPVGHALHPRPGTVDIVAALRRLDAVIPAERTLVVDGGRFSHEALQLVGVPGPESYVHALNVAQIGLSVGYGIGAAVGRADRPTLVVCGDGGFMLAGLTEFNTAVREHADLVVAVMNDGAYGAEYYRIAGVGRDASLTTFCWPDLAAVADSLGGTGVTVRSMADFAAVRRAVETRDRPLLVDVLLDRDAVPDPGRH